LFARALIRRLSLPPLSLIFPIAAKAIDAFEMNRKRHAIEAMEIHDISSLFGIRNIGGRTLGQVPCTRKHHGLTR
jgi:hypothetical protein